MVVHVFQNSVETSDEILLPRHVALLSSDWSGQSGMTSHTKEARKQSFVDDAHWTSFTTDDMVELHGKEPCNILKSNKETSFQNKSYET